jgi:hypothetical protein
MAKVQRDAGSRVFDENDARETREASRRIVEEVTKSQDAARAYLVRLGTHTKDGKLAKEYGG